MSVGALVHNQWTKGNWDQECALPVLPAWLGGFQNPGWKWVGLSEVPVCAALGKGQEGAKGSPQDQGWICWKRKEGGHKLWVHVQVAAQIKTFSPLFLTKCRKMDMEVDVKGEG